MITIITPCSRPDNLPKLVDSVGMFDHRVNYLVCYDLSKMTEFNSLINLPVCGIAGGISGNLQRNKLLEYIKDDEFVYCLDDDNLLHPDFRKLLSMNLSAYDIVTFDQQLPDGSIRKGDTPKVTYIDQAQFIIRRSIHEDYEQNYNADGMLIERLVKKYPERWLYIPEVLSYYNRLTWEKD